MTHSSLSHDFLHSLQTTFTQKLPRDIHSRPSEILESRAFPLAQTDLEHSAFPRALLRDRTIALEIPFVAKICIRKRRVNLLRWNDVENFFVPKVAIFSQFNNKQKIMNLVLLKHFQSSDIITDEFEKNYCTYGSHLPRTSKKKFGPKLQQFSQFQVYLSTTRAKQVINLLLLDHFYPMVSQEQVQKKRKTTSYCIYGLVTRYGPQSAGSVRPRNCENCPVVFNKNKEASLIGERARFTG